MSDFRPLVLENGAHHGLNGPDALVVDILKLNAGQAGAGLACMYVAPGVVLTAPASGAIESDGTHLYWTDALGARHALDSSAGGTQTLAQTYNLGGTVTDQTFELLDTKGGGLIVDGTAVGFTGTYAAQIKSTASGLVNFPRVGGLEVTTGSILLGGAGANATSTLSLSTSKTLASPAAGSIWDGFRVENSALTANMGAGNVTVTELVSAHFHQPTITTGGGAGLLTVTDAYTVRIGAPPVGAGSATLTNAWSLGVTGAVRLLSLLFVNPAPVSSGTFTGMTQVAAAHTNLTASAEVPDTNFNLSATKTWATGAITTQRDFLVQARTYAFAAASTVTTGATFAITGAPIAGANATITTPLAFWIQAGASKFVPTMTVAAAAGAVWSGVSVAAATLTLTGATTPVTALAFVNIGQPTVSAASAVVTTDFYTLKIAAPAFTGAGPASATRSWSLGLDGSVKFGGGQTVHGTDVNVAGPYTILPTDYLLHVRRTSAAAISLNLPSIAVVGDGFVIGSKDSGYNASTNNITWVRNGTDTIENVAGNYAQNVTGSTIWLVANATTNNWEIV